MALVVKDRVQEVSTTTGTGTFTLAGAVSGFQSFSVIGDGNTTYYAIVGGAEFEVGLGTYTLSGTTLSRTTVLESSNSGSLVNFSAGTKNVFVTYPAERALYTDASSNAIALGTPASVTLTNGTGLPLTTGVTGTLPIANGGTGTTSTTFTNLTTNVTGTLPVANGGTGATTLTGVLKGNGTSAFTAATAGTDYGAPATASTWSASQRGTVTTDNDLSFDMSVTNNFKCTPAALGTLTFTNITSGQSGFVLLVNTSGYAISAAATTKVSSSALAVISTAGTYLLSYFSDGTNVFVTNSGALA